MGKNKKVETKNEPLMEDDYDVVDEIIEETHNMPEDFDLIKQAQEIIEELREEEHIIQEHTAELKLEDAIDKEIEKKFEKSIKTDVTKADLAKLEKELERDGTLVDDIVDKIAHKK